MDATSTHTERDSESYTETGLAGAESPLGIEGRLFSVDGADERIDSSTRNEDQSLLARLAQDHIVYIVDPVLARIDLIRFEPGCRSEGGQSQTLNAKPPHIGNGLSID